MKKNKKINTLWAIPNILTYIRILIIPAIFCVLYSKKEIYSNYV